MSLHNPNATAIFTQRCHLQYNITQKVQSKKFEHMSTTITITVLFILFYLFIFIYFIFNQVDLNTNLRFRTF